MSQFIEMFKHKKPNGKIADLVDANIKSVKKSFNKEGMIEYIDISSVNAKYRTLNETTQYIVASAPSRAQQCVQNGDILVSTVRPINRNVAVVNSNLTSLVASTGFCVLRPIDGYREYLLAIVTSDKYTEKMCDIASGGLYPAVNNSDVLSYDIFIPDKDFLHRVTQIYQQADKSGFDGFKSQFIEMFGDPVSWQTDTSLPTLNDTVNVISGFPFDSEKFDTEGVGTPLIRIRDIQRGYSETFTTEVFDEQYRIKKYELLVGMDGMFDIARWQSDEAALNQRVCCLRMKGSENDTFIQYLVQPILKHIENGTNATTVKHISTKQINGIRVPIASHEQKNKFAMIANQADKSGSVGLKSGLNFAKLLIHR